MADFAFDTTQPMSSNASMNDNGMNNNSTMDFFPSNYGNN
jgi:hypothetical protein